VFILLIGVLLGYIAVPLMLVDFDAEDIFGHLPDAPVYNGGNKFGYGAQVTTIHSSPKLRPVAGDSKPPPARVLDISGDGSEVNNGNNNNQGMTDAEKRLIDDRNVLSRQSLPTSTTPYVMKTLHLPDHQRKKILVTGGAGFVGSHLVDKLMMEGQEVTVLDNFFTGQKKNIAHWLHHPNFRYGILPRGLGCIYFARFLIRVLFLFSQSHYT
jgi:UDP-glucuronate decarboxylase